MSTDRTLTSPRVGTPVGHYCGSLLWSGSTAVLPLPVPMVREQLAHRTRIYLQLPPPPQPCLCLFGSSTWLLR